MNIISEHEPLTRAGLQSFDPLIQDPDIPDGLLLNPGADEYHRRYFFEWDSQPAKGEPPCYKASYVIGAQHIRDEELIIKPKMDNIDYMKMFSVCLGSSLSPEAFSRIYGIDLEAEPIRTESEVFSPITPLIVVHFIMLMTEITSRGLRRDYISRKENLRKIRGRIDIAINERKNVIIKRFDRIYCKYEERSVNTPENRLFKKALLFCKGFVSKLHGNEAYQDLMNRINVSLSAFESVDDQIEVWEIRNTKKSNLYRDYDEAIRLAKTLLRFFDYSIANTAKKSTKTPVFWIDMSLLYEHYVYGLLYAAYGNQIEYQSSGWFGWKPDFLHKGEKIIMDTKYMPQLEWQGLTGDIVGQLSGYARTESFTRKLGVDEETVVPCLILYPTLQAQEEPFSFDKRKPLLEQARRARHLIKFYKYPVPIPALKH